MFWFIFLTGLVLSVAWVSWTYYRLRRSAKFLSNSEFAGMIKSGQLIDIREAGDYQAKHIMGARNIPASQLSQSLAALRKDKPILIYDTGRSTSLPGALKTLKKAGYTDLYVLEDGIDYWDGKVKVAK